MSDPNGHRAERDGCGCAPWTLRCVHWEGQILRLVDNRLPTPSWMCDLHGPGLGEDFGVCGGKETRTCECGMRHTDFAFGQHFFPSRAEADDEFDRRHIELVGRAPE